MHAIFVHQQYNKIILQNHFKYSDLPDVMSTSTIPKSDYHIFALGEFEDICENPQLSAKDVSCSSLKFGKMCHVTSLFWINLKGILHNCCFKQVIMYLFDSKHNIWYVTYELSTQHVFFWRHSSTSLAASAFRQVDDVLPGLYGDCTRRGSEIPGQSLWVSNWQTWRFEVLKISWTSMVFICDTVDGWNPTPADIL